jgi:hypothetical protein
MAHNLKLTLLTKKTGTFCDYLETHLSSQVKVPKIERKKTWLAGGKSKSSQNRSFLHKFIDISISQIIDVK